MRFDLIDLGLFRHIVEAGSITHGAARANLALAAASKRMRNLEISLNIQLFERARQGITLTPAGRTLLAHAKAMLDQEDKLRGDLHAFSGELAGRVRVLASASALPLLLPSPLGSYLRLHTNAKLELHERSSDEIIEEVTDGSADVGVLAGNVDPGGLESFAFKSDRLMLLAKTDHPLARRKGIAFGDALGNDFVGLDQGTALQQLLSEKALAVGKAISLKAQFRNFDSVCRAVEAGFGIAIVPESVIPALTKSSGLKAVALADSWAARELIICVRRLANLTPEARQLVDHLVGGPGLHKSVEAVDPPGHQGLLI